MPQTVAEQGSAPPLERAVNKVAALLREDHARGVAAALRRYRPGDAPSFAFWSTHAEMIETLYKWRVERWPLVLAVMAELKGLHQPFGNLGATLAHEGYSELRLDRLLRAEGDALAHALRGTAHFLASRGAQVDQAQLARLYLHQPSDPAPRSSDLTPAEWSDPVLRFSKLTPAERIRRRIAKDYFAPLQKKADKKDDQ